MLLKKCTNYKRTLTFLFEEWEALYYHLIESFTSDNDSVHGTIKAIIEGANERGIDSVYDRCRPTIQNLNYSISSLKIRLSLIPIGSFGVTL